ncbi:hypothetical protein B0T22DRAFT_478979 [Podospora appendiculata]|uniref:BTB domain-containing protein n=1 Tax=Podospora appendiculata TaxID=314037 RepID=A0AAE0X8C2_9PEZI|nr:hypothetical protein B0T22DRAFT_478979 [Podospora appendiculata]
MAATVYQVDPKGDILLHFPGSKPGSALAVDAKSHGQQPQPAVAAPAPAPAPARTEPWSPAASVSTVTTTTVCNLSAGDDSSDRPEGSRSPEHRHAVDLRVSSSVLCLVSPVFSAMLNGPMAEGAAFRAPGSPRPFPITLPEDDGDAFAILANVFHHRIEQLSFLPPTAVLLSLAVLVDKYACAPALMPYGVLWLQRAANRPHEDEYAGLLGRCNLLLFAYVLDLPWQFAQLSWDVLLMHRQLLKDETDYGLELPIPPEHELLRHDLHGEIARRKARLRRDIHNMLMDPVSRVTSQLATHGHAPGPTCPNAALAIGNYMALLDANNLSPWRPQFETDSFTAIINRAIEVAADAGDNPMLFFEMCSRYRCACDTMAYGEGVHLARELGRLLKGAWEWKLWVCLDCLKNGGESRDACRVKHW